MPKGKDSIPCHFQVRIDPSWGLHVHGRVSKQKSTCHLAPGASPPWINQQKSYSLVLLKKKSRTNLSDSNCRTPTLKVFVWKNGGSKKLQFQLSCPPTNGPSTEPGTILKVHHLSACFLHLNWATTKKTRVLSMKYWLFNRDAYTEVGRMSSLILTLNNQAVFHCSSIPTKYRKFPNFPGWLEKA